VQKLGPYFENTSNPLKDSTMLPQENTSSAGKTDKPTSVTWGEPTPPI
jgi:hypothetical protein